MSSPYSGLRVLDLLGGLVAGYCCKLFTDGGAQVSFAEPVDGDPLRRWRIGDAVADNDGALFRYLRHGQGSITGEVDALLHAADLVIVGLDGPEPSELRDSHKGLVVLSISPYGRSGPYRDRPATEFTLQCDVGSTAGRGLLHQEPYQAGGRTGDWFAAACGAVAAAGALRRQALSGIGETIDLSIAECINLAMTMFSDLQSSLAGRDQIGRAPRQQETPSIEPTRDGYVGFNTNTRQQLGDFCMMVGRPEVADQFATARLRATQWDEWNEIVHAFTTAHTTAEIVEQASLLRIPVAPVCNGESVQQVDHFVQQGVFIDDPLGDFKMPRRPWRTVGEPLPRPRPAPAIGQQLHDWGSRPSRDRRPAQQDAAPALPLAGLRVIDATAWWAGPTCTNALASLGAEVIHLESAHRPDGMRMIGGYFAHEPQWWEWSFIFASANTNKLGLTLDLSSDRGRELFLQLSATADVVVENYTPRVFENFGLSYEHLRAQKPDIIFARMPAFGLEGPWRDRPGFAQTMEQLTGLAWVTGHVDDQPRIQKGPCDPNAGMHAAFAIIGALMQRDESGQGCELELTMVEAALGVAAEQVIEFSAYGTLMERSGNRSPHAAPQGIYATADAETWVGLAIENQEQWTALVEVLGRHDLASLGMAERFARHDEIDALISEWAAPLPNHDAADQLLAAGVPAAVVRNPQRGHQHPQFLHRDYLQTLEHPVLGSHPFATMPFRYDSVERWLTKPAPTLGQHNDEILTALGLSGPEIHQLAADGVIGDKIPGA